jgi:hypothetical protein
MLSQLGGVMVMSLARQTNLRARRARARLLRGVLDRGFKA